MRAAASRLLWPAGLSVIVGLASVLLFRYVVEYVLAVAIPGVQPRGVDATNMAEAVGIRIAVASVAIAIGVALVLLQWVRHLRRSRGAAPSRAALRVTAGALVVSLAITTVLAITLQSYSRRHLDVALRGAPVSTPQR
jgi:ABC-type xylose transport system permease subunit